MDGERHILEYGGRFSYHQPAGRLQISADETGLTLSDPPTPISRRLAWMILGGAMFLSATALAGHSLARGQPIDRGELLNAIAWVVFGWPMLAYARRSALTGTTLRISGSRLHIERPAPFGNSHIDWPVTAVRELIARSGDFTLDLQRVGNFYIRGRLWDVVVFQRLPKRELEWAMLIIQRHLDEARKQAA